MDIDNKTIWQVAAGDTDRNYANLCLKWDVILNGPGSGGPWPDCIPVLREEWGLTAWKLADLRRFCQNTKEGDLVVLNIGTSDVYGVGIVVGDYEWHDEFGDVDGWDLEHVRRVRWLWRCNGQPERFDTRTLKRGTIQTMDAGAVKDWLKELDFAQQVYQRPLRPLPGRSSEADVDDTSEYLFDYGVGSNAINALVNEIGELSRIAKWYQEVDRPSERI